MRILHVVPSYVPAWRYGGPIRSVHGLCKALVEAGHDVEVFTTNADGPGELDVPVGTPVEVEGVKVWYFPTRNRRLYWSPEMGKALGRHTRTFEVMHLHSIYLWPTTAGARAARLAHVPYVISPRGMLMRALIHGKSRWVKTAWIRLIERGNLARAAATHFTSSREAAEAAELGLQFQRVLVIPNGMEVEARSDAPPEPLLPAFPVPANPFLLFIGRLSWEKGLDRLIAALAHVPGVPLIVAGSAADEAFRSRLDALAKEHGVTERVTFVGAVHGHAKAWLLDNAAMLVLPSYAESFGNVVLEAMAAGCPVVVTPEVGAAEVVRESNSGAVLPGDPHDLASGIRGLLEDRAALRQMGDRGRAAFEKTFTWSAVASQMARAYTQIPDGQAR